MSNGGFLDDVDDEPDDEQPQEVEVVDKSETSESSEVATVEAKPQDTGSSLQLAGDLDELAETYEQYEKVKTKLLNNDDRQKISGSFFIKKSGWRKIATAFNVSVEIAEKYRTVEDGVLTWRVVARATAPNGRTIEATGSAASNESNHMGRLTDYDGKTKDDDDVLHVDGSWRVLKDTRAVNEHDILGTAETRAKNRAISDLVGGGEVSAEEMDKADLMG